MVGAGPGTGGGICGVAAGRRRLLRRWVVGGRIFVVTSLVMMDQEIIYRLIEGLLTASLDAADRPSYTRRISTRYV